MRKVYPLPKIDDVLCAYDISKIFSNIGEEVDLKMVKSML